MNVSLIEQPRQADERIAASKPHCELITNFSQLEKLSVDWERLWRADPDREIFQSFRWARAWWQSYGDKLSLRSLAVFEGERLIGILPLVQDGEQIVFLGGSQADYSTLVCENDRAAEVFEAALDTLLKLADWKECVLSSLKLDGQILKQLATLPKRLRCHLQKVYVDDCYTILLSENRDALASLLGKHHTKRRLNKLRKAGALTFRHIESKAEAQVQLSEFLRHQTQARALAGKSRIPPEFCSFLRNLISELDLTRELRFGVLELNDRPLAWHLSFHLNDKLLFYQQTFDVDSWDYSPGEVLVHELLRYVKENAIREFDFAHGAEPYKNRFTTHRRKSYSLYIERDSVRGRIRRILRAGAIPWILLGRHAIRLAKNDDKTFRRLRSVRMWLAGVLSRVRYYRKKRALTRWAVSGLMRLPRSIRFSKSPIHFFPPDWLSGKPGVSVVSNSILRVGEGHLGDLVDISLRHPELVVPSDLARYRRRLKKGDRVYFVKDGEQLVMFAWTAISRSDDVRCADANHSSPANAPLLLLEECTAVSKLPERVHYRELLCTLLKEAEKRRAALGVCCWDPVLRSELEVLESI
jgi:CelD/BcsL family acetyltransferase involved in cellulose biosynthesis